jgi:hypothetical protein
MSAQPSDPSAEEIEIAVQAHEQWVAAGRPGAQSHDDVMDELLAPSGGWNPASRA